MTAAKNYTISRLSNHAWKNCIIFLVNGDRKICTILEPSKLPDKIAQFLEGRMVPLQNCTIS